MKELIEYIPKKYRSSVVDFYKEFEDGNTYWLTLKHDGMYYLSGYFSEYTIHEDTIFDVLRVLREHITEKESL